MSPHSGQLRIGGRGRADILSAAFRQPNYLPGVRVCMSAQHKVTANTPKAAAIIIATIISVGIDLLPYCGSMILENHITVFDLDQIRRDNLRPALISAALLGRAYERPHAGRRRQLRSAATMRRRVGSANVSKALICMVVHMYSGV